MSHVCDHSWKNTIITCSTFIGYMIGSVVGGNFWKGLSLFSYICMQCLSWEKNLIFPVFIFIFAIPSKRQFWTEKGHYVFFPFSWRTTDAPRCLADKLYPFFTFQNRRNGLSGGILSRIYRLYNILVYYISVYQYIIYILIYHYIILYILIY